MSGMVMPLEVPLLYKIVLAILGFLFCHINLIIVLLYTKDKEAEREIRETSPFTIATNNIKNLGVTLTKEVKDLFDKIFKVLKKEIEEDTRKWKDLPCSWIGRINIVKMAVLPKAIYRFSEIPHQNPNKILHRP